MLGRSDDIGRPRPLAMVRFVGLALVVLLGVGLATNFFVIPGIIVGSRWIMAPGVLVSERTGVFAALGRSYAATEGNTTAIGFAAVGLMLLALFVTSALEPVFNAVGRATIGVPLLGGEWMLATNMFLLGLSIAVYRRLNGETAELAEIFA